MSESDKSGKPELTAETKEQIFKWACEIEYENQNESTTDQLCLIAERATLHERSASQARITELESISKALIKTLQVSLPIVSAPLRETFEIAIAKAKDKLLKP